MRSRAVQTLFVAGVIACVGCGEAHKPSPVRVISERHFDQASVAKCLYSHRLSFLTSHRGPSDPPELGVPGVTGTLGLTPSPETQGYGPILDPVQLFFFRTAREAESNAAALADVVVYFHGPYSYLKGIRAVPPDAAALRSIEERAGNVDVFWNYPRQRPARSARTLAQCLR